MNLEQLIKELQERSRARATMIKMNHYHEFAFRPDDLDQLIKDTVNISHQAGRNEAVEIERNRIKEWVLAQVNEGSGQCIHYGEILEALQDNKHEI